MTDKIEIIEWADESESNFKYVTFGHVAPKDFLKALESYYVRLDVFEPEEAAEEAASEAPYHSWVVRVERPNSDDYFEPCAADAPGALAITETGWVG